MSSQTDYFFSEFSSIGPFGPYTYTFPLSLKCQSSRPPPRLNHHHPPPPGVRSREGVEDGWHLRLVSCIIVKNLDTIGFTRTACVKDLQSFDQHHDPITVNYIAFGGKEITDKLIYDRINLLSSRKGALSVHCSPLLSSSLFSFYY